MPSPTRQLRGWDRKPPSCTKLDWSNPLTRGLRWCLPFNQGGGSTLVGSLSGVLPPGSRNPITAGTLGSGVRWNGGRGLTYTSSTTSYVDLGANDDTTGEITWLAWVRPTSLAALSTIFGQNRTGGEEAIDSVYFTTGGNLSWWIRHSGGEAEILNGTASSVAVNNSYRICGRRSGTTGSWTYTQWINEEQNDTATSALNPIDHASSGNFRVGFAGAYTGAPFVGDYDLFMFWNGIAWPDGVIKQLSRNPWQLFLAPPPKRRVGGFTVTPPGPAGAFNAAWARNVNQFIGGGKV